MLRFTEIVGLGTARQALMLLAIDPRLGGAILPAEVGSGKSTLARAFADILPEGTPFIELPLAITEDRLLGGIDLEATLATGQRVVQRGVLARAHGGVLHVDALDRLDPGAASHLVEAMSRGEVHLEREGLSEVHAARFMLIGSYDPQDGEVRMGLMDRVGLIVPFAPQREYEARRAVVARVLGFDDEDADEAALALEVLRTRLAEARARLASVRIDEAEERAVAETALALGVEGNRADLFAVRAALASAALAGREQVAAQDVETAVRLVLIPRATRLPDPTEQEPDETPPQPESPTEAPAESTGEQAEEDTPTDAAQSEPPPPAPDTPDTPEEAAAGPVEDIIFEAEHTELPEDLLSVSLAVQRRSRAGSRGAALNPRRGRFVRAEPGSLREGRVALIPTLMAAAPWQPSRRDAAAASGTTRTGLLIQRDDVRTKRYRDKAGTLFVFLVDASGSMALNRMRQAKGAVASLLQNAYVHRDQVALIAFRGARAEVLLPPSQSVDRAKRELDVLPTGGGTPLASALHRGLELARQARSRGITQVSFVLITDGRGNVSLQAGVDDTAATPSREVLAAEVERLAGAVAAEGIAAIVIDTQASYLSRGEARRLSGQLGGRYFYLPNARAEQIVEAALS